MSREGRELSPTDFGVEGIGRRVRSSSKEGQARGRHFRVNVPAGVPWVEEDPFKADVCFKCLKDHDYNTCSRATAAVGEPKYKIFQARKDRAKTVNRRTESEHNCQFFASLMPPLGGKLETPTDHKGKEKLSESPHGKLEATQMEPTLMDATLMEPTLMDATPMEAIGMYSPLMAFSEPLRGGGTSQAAESEMDDDEMRQLLEAAQLFSPEKMGKDYLTDVLEMEQREQYLAQQHADMNTSMEKEYAGWEYIKETLKNDNTTLKGNLTALTEAHRLLQNKQQQSIRHQQFQEVQLRVQEADRLKAQSDIESLERRLKQALEENKERLADIQTQGESSLQAEILNLNLTIRERDREIREESRKLKLAEGELKLQKDKSDKYEKEIVDHQMQLTKIPVLYIKLANTERELLETKKMLDDTLFGIETEQHTIAHRVREVREIDPEHLADEAESEAMKLNDNLERTGEASKERVLNEDKLLGLTDTKAASEADDKKSDTSETADQSGMKPADVEFKAVRQFISAHPSAIFPNEKAYNDIMEISKLNMEGVSVNLETVGGVLRRCDGVLGRLVMIGKFFGAAEQLKDVRPAFEAKVAWEMREEQLSNEARQRAIDAMSRDPEIREGDVQSAKSTVERIARSFISTLYNNRLNPWLWLSLFIWYNSLLAVQRFFTSCSPYGSRTPAFTLFTWYLEPWPQIVMYFVYFLSKPPVVLG